MSGRSRWWGGLSSLIWFAAAAGCSQLPIPPYSDAGGGDAAPPMTFGPRALTPVPVDAVALAADDSGIYWTTPANDLWVLPAGSILPLPLAHDSGATVPCSGPTAPLLTPANAFWMGGDRASLHRTSKDGGSDQLIATLASGDALASDDSAVYWTELAGNFGHDGGIVRSLSQEAAPGSPPTTLVRVGQLDGISSLAAKGGALFWTPYPTGATVYYADIWSGPVASLAGGATGAKLDGLQSPFGLTTAGGDLYFGFYQDLWTTGLGHLAAGGSAEQAIATLPTDEYCAGLAVADGWLLASTYPDGRSCSVPPTLHLYATPLAGGAPKLIAVGLRTTAISAPQGIVFVDRANHLVALRTSELATIVSPVP